MLRAGIFVRNFVLFACILRGEATNLVNLEVNSTVDVQKLLVTENNEIVFSNNGPEPVTSYRYVINEPEIKYISCFSGEGVELFYNHTSFKVELGQVVEAGQSCRLSCNVIYAWKIVSVYNRRKFNEDQMLKFEGNSLFWSPYHTEILNRKYLTPNNTFIETPKMTRHVFEDNVTLNFVDLRPYSFEHVLLVFVNNDPLLTIKKLERIIDVSHYGKILIEDRVFVENCGTKLVGPYKYSISNGMSASTDWLQTFLPSSANNVILFDELGFNFHAQISPFNDFLVFNFKFRYPLLGGWKTYYVLQYDVPTYEYLFKVSDTGYVLKIRAFDHVLTDVVIENVVIKILFPEGAQIGELTAPKDLFFEKEEVSRECCLLVFGRPTVVLNGTYLFEKQIAPVSIEYFFSPVALLRAPLVIAAYLESVFLIILTVRYCISKK